jgi:hypothetical protein
MDGRDEMAGEQAINVFIAKILRVKTDHAAVLQGATKMGYSTHGNLEDIQLPNLCLIVIIRKLSENEAGGILVGQRRGILPKLPKSFDSLKVIVRIKILGIGPKCA